MRITKLGSRKSLHMLDARLFNHGERSMKIRKRFFRSLKRRLKRVLDKQDYDTTG